ncbi:MAG: response regulator [Candidatus Nanoarchaeia archaeon]|jgi:DNA-binding NtrC family response regulator
MAEKKKFLGGKKLKFMIVDDDPSVREIVVEILKVNGQEITEAIDGNACIRQISAKPNLINIILLDIRMPGLLPKEMIKLIKSTSPKTYVIYLTSVKAYAPAEQDVKMGWTPELSLPVIGFIEKPVNATKLLNSIQEAIEKYAKNLIN